MTPARRLVFLLRHAKSSWDDSGVADLDRPLARRGRRAVGLLCDHIAALGDRPDLVLCSPARRAVETWEGIAPALAPETVFTVAPELYGASGGELLRRLQAVPDEVERLMLIGHNPGMGDLAVGLARHGDPDLLRRLDAKFPTGALATVAVEGPWSGLRWAASTLLDYVVPRSLADGAS